MLILFLLQKFVTCLPTMQVAWSKRNVRRISRSYAYSRRNLTTFAH